MNEKLSYHGAVTLVQRVNNRIVSQKYYNRGENHLFEAYSRALCGQDISNFIPDSIDVGVVDPDSGALVSIVKSGVTIPVHLTYKGANTDGAEYGVPYCRANINLFANMFEQFDASETLTVQLLSKRGNELATVEVEGLAQTISTTTPGIQLIMLWDLYVTNEKKD